MMHRIIYISLVVFFALAAPDGILRAQPEASAVRTWKSRTGNTLEASFEKMQYGAVHLRKLDGKIVVIKKRDLSDEDQKMIDQMTAKATPTKALARTANLSNKQAAETGKESDHAYYTVKVVARTSPPRNMSSALLALPEDGPGQKVYQLSIFPKPDTIITEATGQKLASFKNVSRIGFVANVRLSKVSFSSKQSLRARMSESESEAMKNYLSENDFVLPEDSAIKLVAQKTVKNSDPKYKKGLKLYRFIGKNVKYAYDQKWDNARTVLDAGKGSCSEQTFVYMSLCRSQGIHCRYVGGTTLRKEKSVNAGDKYIDATLHRWVELYIPGSGWVFADPTWAIAGDQYFGTKQNTFLATYRSDGGPSKHLGWNYVSTFGSAARGIWYSHNNKIGKIISGRFQKQDSSTEALSTLFSSLTRSKRDTPAALPIVMKLISSDQELPLATQVGMVSYLKALADYESIPLLIELLADGEDKHKESVSRVLAAKMGIKGAQANELGSSLEKWRNAWLKHMSTIEKDFAPAVKK